MYGQRQLLLQSFLVSFLSRILALLCRFKERVISAAEMSFEITPSATNLAAYRAALFDIANALFVQMVLDFSSERRALQGLRHEIAFERGVIQMFPNLLESFLTIDQALNHIAKRFLYVLTC